MNCVVKFLVLTLAVLFHWFVPVRMESFLNTPPPGYNERTSVKVCDATRYSDDTMASMPVFAGTRAYLGDFKHMVAIGWTQSDGSIDYLCGGSLISKRFVLTAAHCNADATGILPDTIRLGDTDLGSTEDDEFAQQIPIARMIVHPRYQRPYKYFDVALIKLQRMAQFTEAVCSACLWQEKDLPEGPLDAVGFGATGFGEPYSPTLQRVVLNHIDQEQCKKRIAINWRHMPEGFREDQFCASGENSMDTCQGDSGGPIEVKRFIVGGNWIPMVAGVVSFGKPCILGSAGVYTKVSEYIDWIERTTNKSYSYAACHKRKYCIGRRKQTINVNFKNILVKKRFGLLWQESDSSLWECGATLIDHQFFVTAASCVTTHRGNPKFVVSKKGERAAITGVYVSPRYRPGRPENDIALVKIGQYVNRKVYRPACLWDRRADGEQTIKPTFIGYGKNGIRDHVRETVVVKALNGTGCEDAKMRGTDLRCFHNQVPLMPGVCWMDHGGPIFLRKRILHSHKQALCGVVSPLSKGCGSNLYMIDITPHIEWIDATIRTRRDMYVLFSD